MKLKDFQIFHDYSAESLLFIKRITFAFVIIILISIILFVHLYRIQIVNCHIYTTRSNENRIKLIPIPPKRGLIYDRNGIALAINRPIYNLEITPAYTIDLDQTIYELQALLHLTTENITQFKKERKRSSQFVSLPIKIGLTEEQQARFAVNQFRFDGVTIKRYLRRA